MAIISGFHISLKPVAGADRLSHVAANAAFHSLLALRHSNGYLHC